MNCTDDNYTRDHCALMSMISGGDDGDDQHEQDEQQPPFPLDHNVDGTGSDILDLAVYLGIDTGEPTDCTAPDNAIPITATNNELIITRSTLFGYEMPLLNIRS